MLNAPFEKAVRNYAPTSILEHCLELVVSQLDQTERVGLQHVSQYGVDSEDCIENECKQKTIKIYDYLTTNEPGTSKDSVLFRNTPPYSTIKSVIPDSSPW